MLNIWFSETQTLTKISFEHTVFIFHFYPVKLEMMIVEMNESV